MGSTLAVFGGGGFIGGNLCRIALSNGWQVLIASRREHAAIPGARWLPVDITDAAAVRRLLAEAQPEAVVDLAAMADIDRAQVQREAARGVNVLGARIIAEACAERGSAFLYFSSDAVFSGTAPEYREEDPVDPVNYYGQTKAEGERAVLAAHPGAAVVRISLALGFPVTDGNSFFAALAAKLEAGAEIAAPRDEIRTPVDVLTLSECVLELLELRFAGVVHLGATGSIDRASLTRKVAALLGYPSARILEGPAGEPAGRAPRHKNGIIRVGKAQALLATPLLSVERSIERAVRERLKER